MSLRELREGTGLVGVGPVEVRYELLCVSELRGQYPRGFFVGAFVSGPSDQVQELAGPMSPVDLRVENLRDSYSGSPSTLMGGGGVWTRPGMEFGVVGSS